MIDDSYGESNHNQRRQAKDDSSVNGRQRVRGATPDSLDILGSEMDEEDDFVVDDDGAGYAMPINGNGKREYDAGEALRGPVSKKLQQWSPRYHEPLQPGATPWRGKRRYMCLNLVGCVWAVDQDTHHTVTVDFYDRDLHRDFHFTDTFRYDKACLSEQGTLFSCPADAELGVPATIFYRPHETWTERQDWRTTLPKGEEATAISLGESFVTVITSTGYVRIFTLFLTPYRVYRQKSSPAVACASWKDYVLTMGNGAVGADGCTQLLYTIEDVKSGRVCQMEDVVALQAGAKLATVFFSDRGVSAGDARIAAADQIQDPCIYDSDGTLLTLLHWRSPSQAQWTPLLSTRHLARLASGLKTETYWPVAVAGAKFHCIILKGGDRYPYFPRPLLSEFEFEVPLRSVGRPTAEDEDTDAQAAASGSGDDERERLESLYVQRNLDAALAADTAAAAAEDGAAGEAVAAEATRSDVEVDKALLQLLAVECREGEERGMRALELVRQLRGGDRMAAAAVKIAERYGRIMLGEKINELVAAAAADAFR
jgi:chromosome transmission fidelity protein 4